MNYSICYRCGQAIKNVIIIDGKNYGTTCAEKILDRSLPKNFSGDYSLLLEREAVEQNNKEKLTNEWKEKNKLADEITAEYWPLLQDFSQALSNAKNRFNDWEINFVYSVARQIFGGSVSFEGCHKYTSMEDAQKDWNSEYMGSFPYLYYKTKDMSAAQKRIFDRILNS